MKPLLNTLFVTTEGAALRKDGENVVAEIDGAERARVPMHKIGSVVVFGAIFVSPPLIQALAAGGVSLVLLDRAGRFQARVEGPVSGNVLLRRAQYRTSDTPAEIVRSIVTGKVANQRAVLQRSLRDSGDSLAADRRCAVEAAVERLARILRFVAFTHEGLDRLRGAEGEAAQCYFSVFDDLVRSDDPAMRFLGRSRRPPLGFLHRDRPGRPSLALDLMEEMRPVLADRLALTLLNRRQLRSRDFVRRDGGAVLLTDDGRRTVLTAWTERKKEQRRARLPPRTGAVRSRTALAGATTGTAPAR